MALTVDYRAGVLKDIRENPVAKETGISAPNLHRALSVRGNPTMRTFGKIAASISAFLGFQTPMAVFS